MNAVAPVARQYPIRGIHQMRTQMVLLNIFWTVGGDRLKRLASMRQPPSPLAFAARICNTISTVSFLARFGDTEASSLPPSTAWRWFCLGVHQTRFSITLLSLLKSKWFTCAVACGGSPMNASATNRCTFNVATTFFFDKCTCRYPALSSACARILPCLSAWLYLFFTMWSRLLTLPRLLTSYKPSYPGTDFQTSIGVLR